MLSMGPVKGLLLLNGKIGMLDDVDIVATDEAMVDVSIVAERRLFLRQLPSTVYPLDAANSYHHKYAYIRCTQTINTK